MRDLAHNIGFLLPHLLIELCFVARLLIRIIKPSADIPETPHNRELPPAQRLLLEADGTLIGGVCSTRSCS
jgi:hypothetical protein